jgi:hypothetical protein
LKAGQSQLTDFESQQSQLADFGSQPEPILPVFKSFSQIQKFSMLNGKEFINST